MTAATSLNSGKRPDQFRTTDAGLLPADWDALTLGEVIESTQLGGNYPNSPRETRWPLIKMGNIGRGSISLSKIDYVPRTTVPHGRDRLRRGDVIFNTRNTLDLVGKACIWNDELPEAYFNSNIMRLTFRRDKVASQRYMNYVLNSARVVSMLRGIATGTTSVAAIYYRDLAGISIALPHHKEQRAIAEALSDADALIESLETLIAKKRAIKQGAIQELLSGRKRLAGYDRPWQDKQLGELATLSKAAVNPALSPEKLFTHFSLPAFDEGKGPVVEEGRCIASNKFWVPPNCVMVSKLNPRIPRIWCPTDVPENAICSTEFLVLVPNQGTDRRFLAAVCQSPWVCSQLALHAIGTTGSHQRINPNQALTIRASVPTDEAEQASLASVLNDFAQEIAALDERLAKAHQVKQGMMQELLTGRVRLA